MIIEEIYIAFGAGLVRLTVHGGVEEIGGNKVLLEAEGGSVWLDFGLSFSKLGEYYCEFCQPRSWSFVRDQLALGLLPELRGMYRPDLLRRGGRAEEGPASADGVFISHAHMDHVGMVPTLRPDVPIHMAEASEAILRTLDTHGQSLGMPDRFLAFTRKFELLESKRGGLKKGQGEDVREPRDIRVFASGEEVEVERGLSVRPMAVDHSLPGAHGFIVHADGRTWVYTGDLRFHGRHRERSRAFVDAAASEDVDVLVTEGTRVRDEPGPSEAEILDTVTGLMGEADGLVLANYPARDLDRIVTFHEAARRCGRELVVDPRQALLMDNLAAVVDEPVPRLGDGLRVFARRRKWGVVGEEGFPDHIQEQDYETWERRYAFSEHRVLDHEVSEEQDAYVFFLDFFHLQVLLDLHPRPGSMFIRSLVEPFNEELELDEQRVLNWMGRFGLEMVQAHASGHASGEDLRLIVDELEPRVVVPIHTEAPEAFRAFHRDVRPPVLGQAMDL